MPVQITGVLVCVTVSYFVFCVFLLCYCLVVSISAIDCLERLVSEMTYYVLSRTLNTTHLLIHLMTYVPIYKMSMNQFRPDGLSDTAC